MENSTRQNESKVSIYKVVPSAITIIGMCFGLTSIRMSLEGFHELAASLILLAAVADGLDGLAARQLNACLLYTSPSPRDLSTSRMPSSA